MKLSNVAVYLINEELGWGVSEVYICAHMCEDVCQNSMGNVTEV